MPRSLGYLNFTKNNDLRGLPRRTYIASWYIFYCRFDVCYKPLEIT